MSDQTDYQVHWNTKYESTNIHDLGWYQDVCSQSLSMIQKLNLDENAKIVIAGAGASTLVDSLIDIGYSNLIATDISKVALQKLKDRLGDQASRITWKIVDLTKKSSDEDFDQCTLWHDRAVLHFFNNDDEKRNYVNKINNSIKSGGYVILAQFALDGAKKCSGLDVTRYSAESLQETLGNNFSLVTSFDYVYTMPSGDTRPYVYALFRKN